jgi:hypothetical protein
MDAVATAYLKYGLMTKGLHGRFALEALLPAAVMGSHRARREPRSSPKRELFAFMVFQHCRGRTQPRRGRRQSSGYGPALPARGTGRCQPKAAVTRLVGTRIIAGSSGQRRAAQWDQCVVRPRRY